MPVPDKVGADRTFSFSNELFLGSSALEHWVVKRLASWALALVRRLERQWLPQRSK